MDRRLEKHPYAFDIFIDAFIVYFSTICLLRQMDRLLDKHPDAFNTFIE